MNRNALFPHFQALELHRSRPGALAAARAAAQRGMTLVEILVVLAIIGLIMGGVAVVAGGQFTSAQDDTARNEITKIEGLVEMYMVQKKGKCPASLEDLKAAGVMRRVAKDPWGNDWIVQCPGEHGDVDISSPGRDGEIGTADDVNSWAPEGDAAEDEDKG